MPSISESDDLLGCSAGNATACVWLGGKFAVNTGSRDARWAPETSACRRTLSAGTVGSGRKTAEISQRNGVAKTNVLWTLDFSVAASASEWTDHHSLALATTQQIKVCIFWAIEIKPKVIPTSFEFLTSGRCERGRVVFRLSSKYHETWVWGRSRVAWMSRGYQVNASGESPYSS